MGVTLLNGTYQVVEVDPTTFMPIDSEQIYSPLLPNTDAISQYIDEALDKEKKKQINK